MKVIDFLKIFDSGVDLKVLYYIEENECVWQGNVDDTPWWIAEMELDNKYYEKTGFKPIEYRDSLGEKYDNKPGLIICIKEN